MSFNVPKWLNDPAKEYWRRVYPEIKDRLNASNIEGFAVLAQTYGDYRQATDIKEKKIYLQEFVRQAKEYGLTPRSQRLNVQPVCQDSEMDELLAE